MIDERINYEVERSVQQDTLEKCNNCLNEAGRSFTVPGLQL